MSALYVLNKIMTSARSNISRTGYETIESLISRLTLTFCDRIPTKYNFYDCFNVLYYNRVHLR